MGFFVNFWTDSLELLRNFAPCELFVKSINAILSHWTDCIKLFYTFQDLYFKNNVGEDSVCFKIDASWNALQLKNLSSYLVWFDIFY